MIEEDITGTCEGYALDQILHHHIPDSHMILVQGDQDAIFLVVDDFNERGQLLIGVWVLEHAGEAIGVEVEYHEESQLGANDQLVVVDEVEWGDGIAFDGHHAIDDIIDDAIDVNDL